MGERLWKKHHQPLFGAAIAKWVGASAQQHRTLASLGRQALLPDIAPLGDLGSPLGPIASLGSGVHRSAFSRTVPPGWPVGFARLPGVL